MSKTKSLIAAEGHFPGIADLVASGAPNPVQAELLDGTRIEGELTGFFTSEERLEIRPVGAGDDRSIPLANVQWLKFTHPVNYTRNVEAFRKHGITV